MFTIKSLTAIAAKRMLVPMAAGLTMFFDSCSKDDSTAPVTMDDEVLVAPNQAGFVKQPALWSVKTLTGSRASEAGGINPQYLLYTSSSYNKHTSSKWPVIIFLHGIGERGINIDMIKKVGLPKKIGKQTDFMFLVIAPQCKPDTWWDIRSLNALYAEVIEKYNVDPQRIYLTGLSMGGYGAWDWAMLNPEKFAAVAPICGGADYLNKAANMKNVPAWTFHNTDDPTVGVENTREIVSVLRKAGNTKVKFTETPTGGHDAWTKAYNNADLYSWFKSYRK
jgi:predicted peptidase